jgi:hypothetical protein
MNGIENVLTICCLFYSEIVIFRPSRLQTKLESPKEVYTGSADDFYIKKFLKAKLHGLVGHMTSDNQDQFNTPLCVVYYKVDYELNRKGNTSVFDVYNLPSKINTRC